jgi:hypothetical protein
MVPAEAIRRLVAISDLHLDARPGATSRGGAAAFTGLLTSEVVPDDFPGARLLLLGDTFELLGAPDPIARLDEIATTHPALFAALGACLHNGWHIDLVPGNHDMALSRARVRQRLAVLLGAPPRRLRFHPWVYFVPGVLYAEHGHQHHDLNRFPTVLAPYNGHEQLFAPPLAVWRGKLESRLWRAVADSRREERAAQSSTYRARITEQAMRLALPADLVSRLHDVSRFGVGGTALRLARRALHRTGAPDSYLIEAARRVHGVLSRAGDAVPVYAFGHTHRARTVALDGEAQYVNTGTWCDEIRGTGPDRDDPALFPYLALSVDDRPGARPELRYWRA